MCIPFVNIGLDGLEARPQPREVLRREVPDDIRLVICFCPCLIVTQSLVFTRRTVSEFLPIWGCW
jgi:hypothetical protein